MMMTNVFGSLLQAHVIVIFSALSATLLFFCGELGVNLFSMKESEEFARLARRYSLAGECLGAEAPNLRYSWNCLVHYRRLQEKKTSDKESQKVSSKRLKAHRRSLRNSKRTVEAFLRGYVASYGSPTAQKQLNIIGGRWETWRAVTTAMGLTAIGLCLVVPIMTRWAVWAHNPVVTNLPLIALILELCFVLFTNMSFKATYRSECRMLFSLVLILHSERAHARHEQ